MFKFRKKDKGNSALNQQDLPSALATKKFNLNSLKDMSSISTFNTVEGAKLVSQALKLYPKIKDSIDKVVPPKEIGDVLSLENEMQAIIASMFVECSKYVKEEDKVKTDIDAVTAAIIQRALITLLCYRQMEWLRDTKTFTGTSNIQAKQLLVASVLQQALNSMLMVTNAIASEIVNVEVNNIK